MQAYPTTTPVVWLAATRPRFLSVMLAPALLGAVLAWWQSGALYPDRLLLTLLAAALAHAGANVLNDYYDHRSGADAANRRPLSPYTGGSRMIQTGRLTPEQTARLGWLLFAAAAALGLWLTTLVGTSLLLLGVAGLSLGYAYSAPPLALCYRGLGELVVGLAFGPLALAGGYLVQTGRLDNVVLAPGLVLGLLAAAILYINQFPDRQSDAEVGKRTLVVRLGIPAAGRLFALWPVAALLVLSLALLTGVAPPASLLAVPPLLWLWWGAVGLARRVPAGDALVPMIRRTIATHAGVSLLLSLAYLADGLL